MTRLFVIMLSMTLVASCGQGGNGTERGGSSQQGAHGGEASEPVTMIPDGDLGEFERLADASIRPYFDAAAAITELAVAPNEQFDVYIFAEYNELYPMMAAIFKVAFPEGVSILGSKKLEGHKLSMGNVEEELSLSFPCSNGPKLMLVSFICKATEDFAGGEIRVMKTDYQNALDLAMCDDAHSRIPAKAGSAVLKRE